jgi:hypothetical protein
MSTTQSGSKLSPKKVRILPIHLFKTIPISKIKFNYLWPAHLLYINYGAKMPLNLPRSYLKESLHFTSFQPISLSKAKPLVKVFFNAYS